MANTGIDKTRQLLLSFVVSCNYKNNRLLLINRELLANIFMKPDFRFLLEIIAWNGNGIFTMLGRGGKMSSKINAVQPIQM